MEKKDDKSWSGVVGAHGGYRELKSYKGAEIIYDATVVFCDRFVEKKSRTHDQMVQAARSGKQNIAEGSMASGTSKKTELKLVGVARASLEELLLDYEDFLRQRGLKVWEKGDASAKDARNRTYRTDKTYGTYKDLVESDAETAANAMICLIHQTNYLLDQQLRQLDKEFLEEGGFTEKLYRVRKDRRGGESVVVARQERKRPLIYRRDKTDPFQSFPVTLPCGGRTC